MNTAKLFTNGRSQAVRLPKEYRFKDDDELCISKIGDMVILYPRDKGWDLLSEGLKHFTEDFMGDRRQPAKVDKRKRL
jgi:antitoxin VapB